MIDILVTGGVGLTSTIISSITTWILARKKYNSEVDNNLINNMKASLDFYEKLYNAAKNHNFDIALGTNVRVKKNSNKKRLNITEEKEYKNKRKSENQENIFVWIHSICRNERNINA